MSDHDDDRLLNPAGARQEINRLRARVEELEDASVKEVLDFGVEQLSRGHDKYHIIATEQINRAWSRLNANNSEVWSDYTHAVYDALTDLNIVPCDECGGSGERLTDDGASICYRPCPSCAERGSNGWRIDHATGHNTSGSANEPQEANPSSAQKANEADDE